MSHTAHNLVLLDRLRADILAFDAGNLDVDAIQASLQQTIPLLERDGSDTARAIDLAENDVEEIRFTRATIEQRPAILRVVQDLLEHLPDPPDTSPV